MSCWTEGREVILFQKVGRGCHKKGHWGGTLGAWFWWHMVEKRTTCRIVWFYMWTQHLREAGCAIKPDIFYMSSQIKIAFTYITVLKSSNVFINYCISHRLCNSEWEQFSDISTQIHLTQLKPFFLLFWVNILNICDFQEHNCEEIM